MSVRPAGSSEQWADARQRMKMNFSNEGVHGFIAAA
jgi:hypothetical protein